MAGAPDSKRREEERQGRDTGAGTPCPTSSSFASQPRGRPSAAPPAPAAPQQGEQAGHAAAASAQRAPRRTEGTQVRGLEGAGAPFGLGVGTRVLGDFRAVR